MLTRIMTAAAASALLAGAAYAQTTQSTMPTGEDRGAAQTSNTAGMQQSTATGDTSTATMPMDSAPAGTTAGTMASDAATTATTDATGGASTTGVGTSMSTGATMSTGSSMSMGMAANVTTTTNGPVADTPESRRLYPPLSRAGKRSSAAGN